MPHLLFDGYEIGGEEGPTLEQLEKADEASCQTKLLAMKVSGMHKDVLVRTLAKEIHVRPQVCDNMLKHLAEIAFKELKTASVFNISGICKFRVLPQKASRARVMRVFGKLVVRRAQPTSKSLKAYPDPVLGKALVVRRRITRF